VTYKKGENLPIRKHSVYLCTYPSLNPTIHSSSRLFYPKVKLAPLSVEKEVASNTSFHDVIVHYDQESRGRWDLCRQCGQNGEVALKM